MRKFETDVHRLKYRILKAVAKRAFQNELMESYYEIPKEISPGPKATMRCCIYKERAIAQERVKLAMGGDRTRKSIVEVIDIACDECPVDLYTVGQSCRGCIASRCIKTCPKGAITKGKDGRAHIDPEKCVECGRCAKVCPYGAISANIRPCERSCQAGAIKMNAEKKASIDEDKCVNCGACVYHCPFGAVVDRSFMVDAISILKNADAEGYKTVAIVAPSVASQFPGASVGQVVEAIGKLGFHDVAEAAVGADMVAVKEGRELSEKGFLTSSCCPAFVRFIHTSIPEMTPHISHNLSPMAELGKYIKEQADGKVKTVFIGPCTAKKAERMLDTVSPWVDCVITFEELQAMLDAQNLEPENMPEAEICDASYYGRIFARSGGLTEAVLKVMEEQRIDFEVKSLPCQGIEECRAALLKASKGVLDANFIEGMACAGGCIGGAGAANHSTKDKFKVDSYGKSSDKKDIEDAVDSYSIKV